MNNLKETQNMYNHAPIDVNSASRWKLMNIGISRCNATKVVEYILENKKFMKMDEIKGIIGEKSFNEIKNDIVLTLPDNIGGIYDNNKFLNELAKFNDDMHIKIVNQLMHLVRTDELGSIRVIVDPLDKYSNWHKLSINKNDNYITKYSRVTSGISVIKPIIQHLLSSAHCQRRSSDGLDDNWYFTSFTILQKTIDAVIDKFDRLGEHFKEFCIETPRQLTDNHIIKNYKSLAVQWHPDKNKDRVEESTEKFIQLQNSRDDLLTYLDNHKRNNNLPPYDKQFTYDRHTRCRCQSPTNIFNKEKTCDTSILSNNTKAKLYEMIYKYSNNIYFEVEKRLYMFNILNILLNNDIKGTVYPLKKRMKLKRIIGAYDYDNYFGLNDRKVLFDALQIYMNK